MRKVLSIIIVMAVLATIWALWHFLGWWLIAVVVLVVTALAWMGRPQEGGLDFRAGPPNPFDP